ncbi:MAG: flagellar hook-associated protein FlgL [Nitrospirae bacterium]|nr:flagellar hook-associated protein FlgL [Nitrospirota bacterium]
MRVTTQMFYSQFLTGINQSLADQLTDQNEISSTKSINKPSDNPTLLSQVVDYQTRLSQIAEYTKAQDSANVHLKSLDTALSSLNSTVSQANLLAIEANGGTLTADQKLMISDQVKNLFATAVSIGNTKSGSRYIFGGYQSNVAPIDQTTGELTGSANAFNINISSGLNIGANVSAASLFSFSRVNTTDSPSSILPTYNSTNNGLNTIPDADPLSALQTTVPTTPVYTINSGDKIKIGATTYNLTAGVYSTPAALAAQLTTDAGTPASGVTFTYDSTKNKFQIKNTTGAAVTVHWGSTSLQAEQALGFNSSGDQIVSANNGTIESDNAVGNFTASDNIFTTGGGTLNVQTNGNSPATAGGFLINSTNDALTIGGKSRTIADKAYSGADLASALSGLTNGLQFSYDASIRRFTVTNNSGAPVTVNFSQSPQISKMLGFMPLDQTIADKSAATSDQAVGDVNIGEFASLQDVRDTINAAGAGVKAQVVNEGTSANPDYRLVISSYPVGSSDKIDIAVKPDDTVGIDKGRNNVIFSDKVTGGTYTATIPPGNYASLSDVATALQGSLNTAQYSGLSATAAPTSLNITGANDTLVFNDGIGNTLTVTLSNKNYTAGANGGLAGLAADIQNKMNIAEQPFSGLATSYTVDSTTVPGQLTIKNSTGSNVTLDQGGDTATANLGFALPPAVSAATIYPQNTAIGSTADKTGAMISTTNFGVTGNANGTLTINNTNANDEMDVLWSNSGTTIDPAKLGSAAGNAATAIAAASSATTTSPVFISPDVKGTGMYMLSYDKLSGNNMTLGKNITNYNYIAQSSANDSIVIDDGTTSQGVSNSQIVVNVGGKQETAAIARGTYTHDQLAVAISAALNNAATTAGKTDTYTVTYDPNANKFTIAGNSSNADLSALDWSNSSSTSRQLLGYNATDESTALAVNSGSNTIVFNDGVLDRTATIASGIYTSGGALASAIQTALNSAPSSTITDFVVKYDTATNTFSVSTSGAEVATIKGTGTIALAQLGFTSGATVNKNGISAPTASSVSLDGHSDNSVLANYYSFNNNYLNDNNILRALNFLNVSLEQSDTGRIEQAIQYTDDLGGAVSGKQADVGSRQNEITSITNYQTNVNMDVTTAMSNAQDTDIAKVASDLAQKQTIYQALLSMASKVLSQNLFNFLK